MYNAVEIWVKTSFKFVSMLFAKKMFLVRGRTEVSSASVARLPKPVLRSWRFEFYD